MNDAILSLLMTIGVEYIVLMLLIRKQPIKVFINSFFINCFTQPLATMGYHYLIYTFYPESYGHVIIPLMIIELCVFLIESILIVLLLNVTLKRGVLYSLIANLITSLLSFMF
jgi:hypothetical protein